MTQDLKSRLWECAENLRGSTVDRADWKAYILPLLFFKRIPDVWNEETADAAKLFGDADPVAFPEVHRFNVPAGCHWRDVRETPANVGSRSAALRFTWGALPPCFTQTVPPRMAGGPAGLRGTPTLA